MRLLGIALAVCLTPLFLAGCQPTSAGVPADDEAHAVSLGQHMAYFQRYADKLYFAGTASNWELADFYAHELEETAEGIEAADYVEDGVEIAPLLASLFTEPLESVEAAVDAQDAEAFRRAYAGLVTACNTCHGATEHGFVRIIVPEESGYPNQAFAPVSTR